MPEPLRIAVIDSGVHPEHPHIDAGRLLPGFTIAKDGMDMGADTVDRQGHGTAVTAAIQYQAPDALCLPIRVFHEGLSSTARALVAAIDRAVVARVDVINLSLGTVNPAHRGAFAAAADRALAAGILIVAARDNEGTACYPGSLEQVLGVGLDWDCPPDDYRLRDGLAFASGHPRPIPGVPQRRNLFGVSFAVANMTGLLARRGRVDPAAWIQLAGTSG
jgi:subtilisin family serine protease